jgi:hypothetical protein
VQTVTVTAVFGDWRIGYGGDYTDPLPYNIDRVTLDAELEGLSTIGTNDVDVEGGPGAIAPFVITFTDDLGYLDIPNLPTDPHSPHLGGGDPTSVGLGLTAGSCGTRNFAPAGNPGICGNPNPPPGICDNPGNEANIFDISADMGDWSVEVSGCTTCPLSTGSLAWDLSVATLDTALESILFTDLVSCIINKLS